PSSITRRPTPVVRSPHRSSGRLTWQAGGHVRGSAAIRRDWDQDPRVLVGRMHPAHPVMLDADDRTLRRSGERHTRCDNNVKDSTPLGAIRLHVVARPITESATVAPATETGRVVGLRAEWAKITCADLPPIGRLSSHEIVALRAPRLAG